MKMPNCAIALGPLGHRSGLDVMEKLRNIAGYMLSQMQSLWAEREEAIIRRHLDTNLENISDNLDRLAKIAGRRFGGPSRDSSRATRPSTTHMQYTAKDHGRVWNWAGTRAILRDGAAPSECKLCGVDTNYPNI